MKILISIFISFILGGTQICYSQDINWDRAEQLSEKTLSTLIQGKIPFTSWIKDSHYFYYSVKEEGYTNYYLVNAKNGKKRPLILDNLRFSNDYARITGDSLNPSNLSLYRFKFKSKDYNNVFIDKNDRLFRYNLTNGELTEVPYETETPHILKKDKYYQTTDSLYTMLGSGYDLYIRDNQTNKIARITFDGTEEVSYTYRNSKDTIESNSRGFWAGHHYIYFIQDSSDIKEVSIINSLSNDRPTTKSFKMPMPGDKGVKQYRIFWYDADKNVSKFLPIEKYADQEVKLDFFRSDKVLYFTRKSRKADKIDLCRINVQKGTIDELIVEESSPHLNVNLFNYHIVDNGKYFIWWSERTGKGNYYLYDSKGKLLNRITQGEHLVAGDIIDINFDKKELIFAGYGNEVGINPYYKHYYKVDFSGKNQVLLTPGNGEHELILSDDKKFAIDKFSRMDMMPTTRVLSIEKPANNYLIHRASDDDLRAVGWLPPTLVKVKAKDGKTDLYGVMYTPSNIDLNKKYPIISNVYPGPQDDQIPRSFTIDDNGNQSLAELGFIVITVGSRGSSPLRGKEFYCYSYGNLRDYPLEDDKNTIETLAKEYSFIDLDRVGIYGHSGGGFQAATALLTYPDFYKVAVAASGNYNNNIYIQWWGETFHGVEEKVDSITAKSSFKINIPTTMELADKLKGKLLLITGDVDRNVPPASTYQLADALIKANKRFDLFILPGKDHGVMCPYYQNLIRYYFVENLINSTYRHIDIINHN